MRTFTPTEIDLCKKIAEKKACVYLLGEGDYFIYEDPDRKSGWSNPTLNVNDYEPEYGYGKNVPLWQEHDCLEFLREKYVWLKTVTSNGFIGEEGCPRLVIKPFGRVECLPKHGSKKLYVGKTPLEALLRAVLAVMEA